MDVSVFSRANACACISCCIDGRCAREILAPACNELFECSQEASQQETQESVGTRTLELKEVVEVAMFAACTGLAYHLSATLKLESYFGAFFPLPVVLAAARWSTRAVRP